jgi:hypothetical protein
MNNGSPRAGQLILAGGNIEESQIRVPYCIDACPVERKGHQVGLRGDLEVSANGVLASFDGGQTWRAQPIGGTYSGWPVVVRTTGAYYYFAKAIMGTPFELWYARCALDSEVWSLPETMNKSVARKLSENLHAAAEGDTLHLCWLDARHEKTRLSLMRPREENFEVAYTHRKDSDRAWAKDIILSKGLRWAYSPSLSVEGDNVVVAWAGAPSGARNGEHDPSDIYYAFSKDSGLSWTRPLRVTDGFKSGITSARPQIVLHNGVIHLFYVQGKLSYQHVSAGMIKLNQPPWPIYYQQRPFPY